ncbi:TonB-dependent receptor SusC, partial [termite gut metagenome]
VSYMGRVNYQFKNRYMAAATVRRDGFSGFGSENKFVTLPSFSLGWIASEESFMQDISWLYSKLRLSYGQNGNQGIGRYSSMAHMGSNPFVYGSTSVIGVYPSSIGNSGLAWERTTSYNLGIDLGFFDRRINASIDLYTSETSDYSGINARLEDARVISPLANVPDPYDIENVPLYLTNENYMP